jgi:hypothetical protein
MSRKNILFLYLITLGFLTSFNPTFHKLVPTNSDKIKYFRLEKLLLRVHHYFP